MITLNTHNNPNIGSHTCEITGCGGEAVMMVGTKSGGFIYECQNCHELHRVGLLSGISAIEKLDPPTTIEWFGHWDGISAEDVQDAVIKLNTHPDTKLLQTSEYKEANRVRLQAIHMFTVIMNDSDRYDDSSREFEWAMEVGAMLNILSDDYFVEEDDEEVYA